MAFLLHVRNRRAPIVGIRRQPRPRVFFQRKKLIDFTDEDLLKDYRLSRAMIDLADIVAGFAESEMANKTLRSHALCAETQVGL